MTEEKRDFSSLSEDAGAFRQQIRMAAVQVAGLKPEELAQALAYEVEPFSGIAASEAEVTFRQVADPDPSVRVYDVAVKRRRRRGASAGGLDRWMLPAVIFAVVTLVMLAVDFSVLANRKSSLGRLAAERRPLQAQLDRLGRESATVRKEAETIRSERMAAIRAQDEAAGMRQVHADLLAELADACGGNAVVKSIVDDDERRAITVSAIAVSPEAAAEVMRVLTDRVRAAGWMLVPREIAASGSGATVGFGFDVTRAR